MEAFIGEPPRKLSTDRNSPHFDLCYIHVAVTFNGVRRPNDVHEYDIDKGFIIVRQRHRNGFTLRKMIGTVEVTWRNAPATPRLVQAPVQSEQDAQAALFAAEAKRARKAAKLLERGRL